MSIPGSANPLLLASAVGAGGYEIERSLRFNSADSAYLSRTPSVSGDRKTWTWAGWVKRSALGARQTFFGNADATGTNGFYLRFEPGDALQAVDFSTVILSERFTTQVFRDSSAWYHIVLAYDTTNATANNRIRLYVNGAEITTFANTTNPSQNSDGYINNTSAHALGRPGAYASEYLSGYLADIHFIDGQALTPSSFTEVSATTGQLVPKAYTGSYGTNGFHLDFADNSSNTATTLGKDSSGNGNNWTPNNLSVTAGAGNDSLVDTPTSYGEDTGAGGEVRGNYATLNPLDNGGLTLSNGNLDSNRNTNSWVGCRATFGITSGKWYWEYVSVTRAAAQIGITNSAGTLANYAGDSANAYVFDTQDGRKWTNNAPSPYFGSASSNGAIHGIAFDADNRTITFYRGGTTPGVAYSSIPAGEYFPVVSQFGTDAGVINFGQRPFAYTAPSGFKALCTTNLPAPVVAKPSTVFDVALDTGANILTAAQNKLSTGTDLLWIKDRANSNNHQLIDTVRGGTATLQSNTTAAETTYSAPSGSSVAWCWDAGSSTVTNTQGSITSQVRANPSAGFSIVTWTGDGANSASVGHGLGVAPRIYFTKSRDSIGGVLDNWGVFTTVSGPMLYGFLNTTSSFGAPSQTAPTSTTINVVSGFENVLGKRFVAYCFAPVAGYSSFGSYTGNGSADGPFVYTGFRPRWVMIKASSVSGTHWLLIDSTRSNYNQTFNQLYANLANAEDVNNSALDLLSNGFKCRADTFNNINGSGITYIYAAFAENPFQYARAR